MKSGSMVLVLALAFASAAHAYVDQRPLEDADKLLAVSNVVISYAKEEGHGVVTAMGTIRNTSGARAVELVVEVKYFDRNKTLVDNATQKLYGIAIPAGRDVSFRIRDSAAKPEAAYASAVARVVAAEQQIVPQTRSTGSSVPEILINWLPMAIFIGVFLYFIRKMSRKDSPQRRSLELIEKQIQTLERIAAAAEKAAPK